MIPPRAHVGLYKALISLWVIGMCAGPVLDFVLNIILAIIRNLGPVEGTSGGLFDSVRVGIQSTIRSQTLDQPKALFSIVGCMAAFVFLRSPVPKILHPIFNGKHQ